MHRNTPERNDKLPSPMPGAARGRESTSTFATVPRMVKAFDCLCRAPTLCRQNAHTNALFLALCVSWGWHMGAKIWLTKGCVNAEIRYAHCFFWSTMPPMTNARWMGCHACFLEWEEMKSAASHLAKERWGTRQLSWLGIRSRRIYTSHQFQRLVGTITYNLKEYVFLYILHWARINSEEATTSLKTWNFFTKPQPWGGQEIRGHASPKNVHIYIYIKKQHAQE